MRRHGPDERPHDGTTAAATIDIIGKYVELPAEAVKLGIACIDPTVRVNVADVMRQIAWYKAQGMVKPEIDGVAIVDQRCVTPLPAP